MAIDNTYVIRGNFTNEERVDLAELMTTLEAKKVRNVLRTKYYDMKNTLKNMGVAIPKELEQFHSVVGWPKKAIDALANRSIFEGFVVEDENLDAQLQGIFKLNRFQSMYSQAIRSELVHSCCFYTISRGDISIGEPPVLTSVYSAENAAGLWDYRRKRLKAGITVIERSEFDGSPSLIYFYTDDFVHEIAIKNGALNLIASHEHSMGRPLMEVMAFDQSVDRPFGRSRINRAVIDITDAAMRASLRAEVAAEFFTAPQRYILGIDANAFGKKSQFEAYMGHILAIQVDDSLDVPKVGQFDPMSMEPHNAQLRALAARFSGETAIPISSLGIVQDNPASAEAIYASKEDLVIEAQNLNASNGIPLENICFMVIAILEDMSFAEAVNTYGQSIRPKFKSPAMPSIVSQSDAIVKQVAAIPWLADSRIVLEELGYSESQIVQMLAEKRAATGIKTIRELAEENPNADITSGD